MRDPIEQPLHGFAIYNPDLLSKEELLAQFIARRSLLEVLVEDLRAVRSQQHHLIIGQRGMGKTTLLRRLKFAVEDDPVLSNAWLPLTFPEEQYNISRLSDLYVNCLDALGDLLEASGHAPLARHLDEKIDGLPADDEDRRARAALELLLHTADRAKKRLLLLVDNVELIFDRLEKEQWGLRELLSHERRIRLIGASAAPIEATYKYEQPFYDFFRIHELCGLDFDETREVLGHLAELANSDRVRRILADDSARIRAIHVLAGGNPRTIVLLFGVLAQGADGDVRSDLERLLDQCTPLYKARFEALPQQAQQVVDAVALHWHPISAGELAERMRLDTNLVSAQLNRLAQQGVIERVPYDPETKTGFQIAERFFNIWYLMRGSRRVRRRLLWLVELLKIFYSADQLRDLMVTHLDLETVHEEVLARRRAELALALAQAAREESMRLALESAAIKAFVAEPRLRRELSSLVDLQGDDAPLASVIERHEAARVVAQTVREATVRYKGWDAERFADLLTGSLSHDGPKKLAIASNLPRVKRAEIERTEKELREDVICWTGFLGPSGVENIRRAIKAGHMRDLADVEGAKAASEIFRAPEVEVIAAAVDYLAHGGQGRTFEIEPVESAPAIVWLAHSERNAGAGKFDAADAALTSAVRAVLRDRSREETIPLARKLELPTVARMVPDGLWLCRVGQTAEDESMKSEAELAYRLASKDLSVRSLALGCLGVLLARDPERGDEAIQLLEEVLTIEPEHQEVLAPLALLYSRTPGSGGLSRAEEAWSRLAAVRPLKPEEVWLRGVARLMLVMPEEISSALRFADEGALFGEPLILLWGGDWDAAVNGLRDMFQRLSSEDITARLVAAVALLVPPIARLGKSKEMVALLDEIGADERWLAFREALIALDRGPAHFKRLAPEVRVAAEAILDRAGPLMPVQELELSKTAPAAARRSDARRVHGSKRTGAAAPPRSRATSTGDGGTTAKKKGRRGDAKRRQ